MTNEPILEFKPGSPERAALQKVPVLGFGDFWGLEGPGLCCRCCMAAPGSPWCDSPVLPSSCSLPLGTAVPPVGAPCPEPVPMFPLPLGREGICRGWELLPPRSPPCQALADLKGKTEDIPCVIGGEEVWTPTVRYQLSVSRGALI